ncbi:MULTISPECIES: hypothetical protein [Pseudomonas]|uniref:Uncharacterized protein n=1 Tax=Pseudomonas delhiensis TaxID=366289 RepID=A0A239FDT3_9PSED|nr:MULTISPECIES: hypothetical protein [Pseudomonas]MED5606291.1 hypothetical protein [Pseudomonas sp. JH-2]PWU28993.1 hypothetical protein DK254_12545 [Pseudomonas sp. RW407]SDI10178.1 hypothetical protein SAMN05216189_1002119 [Pseudomonas delhiensis]SNS54234.1 hypothetical protein SAMN06295949_103139 [Pseudomonas delhiensis]
MRKEPRPLAKSVRKQAKTPFDPRRAQERLVRLKLQYELLDQRISRVEEGIERPDGTLAALIMRREGLRYDMESQYRLLAG